jgi:hypothetical protein
LFSAMTAPRVVASLQKRMLGAGVIRLSGSQQNGQFY